MSERQIGGRYLLERRIGSGGMGAIWMALDAQLQRRVALKLMASQRVSSAEARQRFALEAKAIARLQHPHVVQVHDYGIDGDVPFIVMELLEGEDFESLLGRRVRLAPAALVPLLNQAARALGAAHAAGIVHRDLKPANLFLARVDGEEVLKVLDFGLALLDVGVSGTGPSEALVGTPRYMSPEQMRGLAGLDGRSDLWSLAVVLYRALTGRFPFTGDELELLRGGATGTLVTPPSRVVPELGAEVDAFFAKALEPDASKRFGSARELAAAFSALVETERSRPAKVLVVDDEPDVEALMRQRFRKQVKAGQYELHFAFDGEDALEKLRQHPDMDAVLSDINMPRMDGLTFLARVGEVNPLVKVVIVSAYSDMSNIRTAMNRGAYDFLVKPLDFQDLEATLTKTLKHVGELRRAVRSTEENGLLRMFVQGSAADRVLSAVRSGDGVTGERLTATLAFIDVKDFAPVALQEQPEVALRRLNANFEVIVPELAARGGVVDKFLGHAVLVMFRGEGHLERALEACVAVRQQLRGLAFRGGEQSPYTHGVRIGLASGEVLSGSVGARRLGRMDFTVVGDVVNTAARLASMAGKDEILIGEELRGQVEARFTCEGLGPRPPPGVDAPLAVHNVMGRKGAMLSPTDTTASLPGREAKPA